MPRPYQNFCKQNKQYACGQKPHSLFSHYCRSGHKIKKATAFIAMAFIYMMITDYSALGASSVVSAAGAAGASVAAALFLERRVRVAFLAVAVLAMFSS